VSSTDEEASGVAAGRDSGPAGAGAGSVPEDGRPTGGAAPTKRGEPVSHLWGPVKALRDEDGNVWSGEYVVVYDEGAPGEAQFDHMAANDPRDTIARCEAELAILDLYEQQAAKVVRERYAGGPGVDAVARDRPAGRRLTVSSGLPGGMGPRIGHNHCP